MRRRLPASGFDAERLACCFGLEAETGETWHKLLSHVPKNLDPSAPTGSSLYHDSPDHRRRMTEPSQAEPNPPAIVVMAYDRPSSLDRLLRSLDRAEIEGTVDLVISVDGGGANNRAVTALAEGFRWDHGIKEVAHHDHLGLVGHFHRCGDLSERFGSVVLLEDDLIVGPTFHRWAAAAVAAVAADDRVAGVCLAAPWFDGYRHLPFSPILDGSAGWYLQVPWFHGMAWTADQWGHYRRWLSAETPDRRSAIVIHAAFDRLDQDEWFPDAVRYLVANERFYLLPREARATNTGAAGQHFDHDSDFFQVPVQLAAGPAEHIVPLDDALAVYDDHLEPLPDVAKRLCPDLADLDLTVDLLAVRDPATITTEWVLTTRPVTGAARTWGLHMRPPMANLAADTPGSGIALAKRAALRTGRLADAATAAKLGAYAANGRPPGIRSAIRGAVGRSVGAWFDG